jgi:hypothetical protein
MRTLVISPSTMSLAALVMAASACCCLAAIPDLSTENLRAAASHIFRGQVLRIYQSVEQTSPDMETTYFLAEIQVDRQEKGPPVGQVVYLRFHTRRYTGPDLAPPGHYGLRNIPRRGDTIRAYAILVESGGYEVVEPNGLVPDGE